VPIDQVGSMPGDHDDLAKAGLVGGGHRALHQAEATQPGQGLRARLRTEARADAAGEDHQPNGFHSLTSFVVDRRLPLFI